MWPLAFDSLAEDLTSVLRSPILSARSKVDDRAGLSRRQVPMVAPRAGMASSKVGTLSAEAVCQDRSFCGVGSCVHQEVGTDNALRGGQGDTCRNQERNRREKAADPFVLMFGRVKNFLVGVLG